MKRLVLLTAYFFLTIAQTNATPLEFTFSASVDATPFGMPASVPLILHYSYDPLRAGTSTNPNDVLYPIGFDFTLGGQTVTATGGAVNTRVPPGFSYSQFYLFAATWTTLDGTTYGQFAGTINGIQIGAFSLNLLNNVAPITMLSSNGLPDSTAFASLANLLMVDIVSLDGSRQIVAQFGAGSFDFTARDTAIPEPSALVLILTGLGALFARRRPRHG